MRPTRLRGARTNNLRNLSLDFEPGTLVAIAGPSGAGKSSLAFGTLYAEGQRRYVESFSAYARQFLERLGRPPVDELEPVPAGIAVDRQAPVKTSRSTVGTMTELTDYAKGLWARAAVLHCPSCSRLVTRDSAESAAKDVLAQVKDARLLVTYRVGVRTAEDFLSVRESLLKDGYRRVRIQGDARDLDEVRPSDVVGKLAPPPKAKKGKASAKKTTAPSDVALLEVVADRTVARAADKARLVEALESALRRGGGRADVVVEGGETLRYSSSLHCAHCDLSFRDATAGTFSFNSPIGACEKCRGFGRTIGVDWKRVIPDPKKTLRGGAIRPWTGKSTTWERKELEKHAKNVGVPLDVPVESLTKAHYAWLLDGDERGWPKGWGGLKGWFAWLESRAYKMHVRVLLSRYRSYETCESCHGTRLKPEAQHWKIEGRSITDFYGMSVGNALRFLENEETKWKADPATALVLRECTSRLRTLEDVGLTYLTLDRPSRTLSGGEAQRVALTSALGASLTGAMFVLDEPTVGLHASDVEKLFRVVRRLTEGENLALVVEHDPAFIEGADRVIELGPGSGEHGGDVVFDGAPSALARAKTATANALRSVTTQAKARRTSKKFLSVTGARGHNLKNVDVRIPVGALTCVTGVSGSGKSSLILETLVPAMKKAYAGVTEEALPYDRIDGAEHVSSVVHVDQTPLGRTSRGNPATYLQIWDVLRKRFATQPLSKERDFGPGFFSFNVPGGRCEACKGEGAETIEMQFLADVTFSCPECGGKRFVGAALDVRIGGKNVADVLQMTASEALSHFAGDAELRKRIAPLESVGLSYLRLGQPLSTLSGGEAQRLKLAEALAEAKPGSLIVLDEPTAGLHYEDVSPLLRVFDELVERGDTVVVVEHDLRVAAVADHVIDLGPGAGEGGGHIVASGTPEEVARAKGSLTAPYLSVALGLTKKVSAKRASPRAPSAESAMMAGHITVRGAREHNLRDVSVDVPREELVVVTGPSGSGKSTLAFDVIHAEAQRRYLETLSPYARQYLPQLPRPTVDRVVGLPPSVSLEQRVTRGGANSTVATVTEIAHYLRLIFARAGLLHCPDCKIPIAPRQSSLLADDVRARFGKKASVSVLAPVVRGRKGHHGPVFARALKEKIAQCRVDGELVAVTRGMKVARFNEHDIDFVLGDVRVSDAAFQTLLDRALLVGDGAARILYGKEEMLLSSKRACPSCGRGFPELDPRFFSFNTKQGACESCEGKGVIVEVTGRGPNAKEVHTPCEACDATRLSPLARSVTVDGRRIDELFALSVSDAKRSMDSLKLGARESEVARAPLKELKLRIAFLERVGLGYLGLERAANTLSGGETQRVRLAAQLGSGLTGVLYVLDEPTIGLHPRDTNLLLSALRALVDKGCSVLVVEHDAETIRAADFLVDVGPGGGSRGGMILAAGKASNVLADPKSVTGQSLKRPAFDAQNRRPIGKGPTLRLSGATEHNLKNVDITIPLGRLVSVTGVSGSGKSTLVREVLLRATRKALKLETDAPGAFKSLSGVENIRRAIEMDQSPIGRTPRSVPATYVGVWDELRRLLAAMPEARARGYTASRFSFNVAEGRCPSCEGQGALSVEMSFLPEVMVPCEECGGMRFSPETRAVQLNGLNVSELLDLDIEIAAQKLHAYPKVAAPLKLLAELGLGYLKLGQPSNTLSGGEAQRIKLVAELGGASGGPTLYVMDEPTTGLHRDDVRRLIGLLNRLVDRGDTVVVIEHHTDVMLASDYIIDMGPEGGAAGGTVVATGTPEEVARVKRSHTGAVIARELKELRGARTKTADFLTT